MKVKSESEVAQLCRLSDPMCKIHVIVFYIIRELSSAMLEVHSKEQHSLSFTVLFSSVAQSCLTLCDPMNRSMPGLPAHHQLPEFTQTQVHQVSDAIQPSYPLSSPSPAFNLSQHQGLFQ